VLAMRKHRQALAKEPPRQTRAIIHVKKSDHKRGSTPIRAGWQ
jgi:hypothetical protein